MGSSAPDQCDAHYNCANFSAKRAARTLSRLPGVNYVTQIRAQRAEARKEWGRLSRRRNSV